MKYLYQFLPITKWLPNYKREFLSGDVSAGLTVGIMLIPQGMAYALIAGLPPVYGLYASIVPQLIYALFGTSRQLSVAPVAMDSLLVAAGVSVIAAEGTEAYITYAILLAFLMGVFQLLLGVFRMGFITNLLARPVISGFTSAAALIIGLNQLKYLLGTEIEKSNNVFEIFWNAIQSIEKTHLVTLLIGVTGILLIKGAKKINQKLPGALIAVVFGILTVYFLKLHDNGVAIVGTIPEGLPPLVWPNLDVEQFGELVTLALTISVVAFMEAYSVAKAIEAKRKDYKVDANQELIGLGAANLFGSLFQSYPVTGGFSRSAVNHQAGANTPLSSIISAVLVGLTLLFLTPLFFYLPKAVLASVIMVAVSGLIDLGYARKLYRENKMEFFLLMATFLVTLNFSMVPGIITGVSLSILLLLYRSAYPHIAMLGRLKGRTEFRNIRRFKDLETRKEVLVLRIDAPITFINIQNIKDFIELQTTKCPDIRKVIVDAGPVSHIDASASEGLTDLLKQLGDQNIRLQLTDVIGPVRDQLHKTGLMKLIGEENIFLTLNDAFENSKDESPYSQKDKAMQHGTLEDRN